MSQLSKIQQELKAPKNQYNQFGGFKYRSAEDILEAVKPQLGDCVLTLSDEIVQVGDRFYVRATVTFREGDVSTSVTAFARETVGRKGMDPAQVTGACSSYARKYALGGLFLCDDQKDPDTMSPPNGQSAQPTPPSTRPEPTPCDPPAPPTPTPPPPQTGAAAPAPANIPAPNPEQRKWLQALNDFYVQQNNGQAVDKLKLVQLGWLHLNRHPGSMSDVEQLKQWIKLTELV